MESKKAQAAIIVLLEQTDPADRRRKTGAAERITGHVSMMVLANDLQVVAPTKRDLLNILTEYYGRGTFDPRDERVSGLVLNTADNELPLHFTRADLERRLGVDLGAYEKHLRTASRGDSLRNLTAWMEY